ncbi:MAG: glyoxalase, partial [Bacteroidota bacterium]
MYKANSIRGFIGARDYAVSRQFYRDLGFEENIVSHNMIYFRVNEKLGFYLQDAYVKDWINNSMLFLEVEDVDTCYAELLEKNLPEK